MFFWFFVALFAYPLAIDKTPSSNRMQLEYSAQPMGVSLPLEKGDRSSLRSYDWIIFGDDGYSEWIPSKSHDIKFLLGTDRFGRDVMSRLFLGSRVSLSVGVISVLIALLIGIPLGAAAGYYGGWLDNIIQTIIQIFWSIPTFLMVIAISFVLGKGFWQVFVAVGLTAWVEVARLVRGQVMSLKEEEYVQAAKVLGFSSIRIIVKHILPQVYSAIIVLAASQFASAILLESGLSFLGIGVQIPMPSWGFMIEQHKGLIMDADKAYLALLPGLAIIILVFAFMTLGNGLRDALDNRDDSLVEQDKLKGAPME